MSANSTLQETLTGKLCVACGLCCSGALFDHGLLQDDEQESARASGLSVVEVEHRGKRRQAFAQPCPQLCGTKCGIYRQQKPKVCDTFFCELAKRLNRGEVDLATAQTRVRSAQELLEQARPLLCQGENWVQARARWLTGEADKLATPANARFDLLMTAINLLYDRYFRRKDEQVISFDRID